MKNLQYIVIEAHELGILNSDLLLFFNNFSFSDNNHYETNIDANNVFPSIIRVDGFNNYCYCFKSYYDEINHLFYNNNCFDMQGNLIDINIFDSLIDSYVEGFISGYENFLNSIKDKQVFFGNHKEQTNLILKRILRPDLQKRGKIEYEEFFLEEPAHEFDRDSNSLFKPPSFRDAKIVFDVQKFYDCGKGGGEYFKAWEIIFENQNIFIELLHSAGIIIFQSNLEQKNNSIFELNDNLSYDDKLEFTENTNDSTELCSKHPFYDNNFNLKCFKLFMYINEKYEKKKKVRFKYIFFFLKEYTDKEVYKFRFTQEQYRNYIFKHFKEVIKNMNKNNYIYSDEMTHLSDLEIEFKNLKN